MKLILFFPKLVLKKINYSSAIFFLGQRYPRVTEISVYTDGDIKEFEEAIKDLDPHDKIVTFEEDTFYEVKIKSIHKKKEVYH